MIPNNGICRGKKRKIKTIDFITNKMQQGLKNIASVLHRRLILTPISENINGLILKNYNKKIRNDGRDRCKQLLILKAIYLGMWEV